MSLVFSAQDKVDIRRHMGYGFRGAGQPGLMYWRFYPHYNTLEWRMDNLIDEEIALVQDQYLPYLNQLEQDIYTARDNLDTKQAAVWYWNDNEMSDRMSLYNMNRMLLCNLMSLPPGPFFSTNGSTIRMAV